MGSTTKIKTMNNNNEIGSSVLSKEKASKPPKSHGNSTSHLVYIVFGSLLLDLLAFTIILPLLPSILERYRVDDSSGLYVRLSAQIKYFQELVGAPEKYNSVLFGGFLGSMFSFLQFVISPIMGGLSDRYGRRPIMLISLVSNPLRL